ncbi:MAG: DUF1684 domain-containing protein [Acidobacteriaceae bacterium]|nr:DUF1684 domain-containing protein [Acidobacteriaceae bacterium]
MYQISIGFLVIIGFLSAAASSSTNYVESIHAWQRHRDAGLRSEDGWLTLVGLFWLTPGNHSMGSADSNDFVLPKGSAPGQVGILQAKSQQVIFTNRCGSAVTVNGKPVSSDIVLSYDEEKPDVVKAGTVSFFVIERSGKLAVRAKDGASSVLKSFTGVTYFPINPDLHFQAQFIPDEKQIPILTFTGQTEMQKSPGIVEFTYKGEKHHLRPIYEGKTLFFLFKDLTNKTETYQAGRMLNTPLPENGKVDIDFNRSYNPPCTFTPYATCPLPPKENILPFPVNAGEKRYGKGHAEYAAR